MTMPPMKTLYLMTARGGSKGVPGKNLRTLGGLSLVGFKTRAAKKVASCSRLVISTDSKEIAEEARRHGAEVPFIRPAHLASDTAKSADVIAHAMAWFEERGEKYDAIMLLEPSAPFTRPQDYEGATELMQKTRANAVVGMRRVEVSSIFVGPIEDDGKISSIVKRMKTQVGHLRQETRQEYTMNGALYLFGWDFFKAHKNIYEDENGTYGYAMPDEYSLEIDEMKDLSFAEFLVEKKIIDLSIWN